MQSKKDDAPGKEHENDQLLSSAKKRTLDTKINPDEIAELFQQDNLDKMVAEKGFS